MKEFAIGLLRCDKLSAGQVNEQISPGYCFRPVSKDTPASCVYVHAYEHMKERNFKLCVAVSTYPVGVAMGGCFLSLSTLI